MSTDVKNLTDEEKAAILEMKRQKKQENIQKMYNAVLGVDPVILLGLGVLVGLMWAICCITQVQTSELMVMGGGQMPVQVQWGIWLQPANLVMGQVDIKYQGAYVYSWVIQTITFVWAYALEHAFLELNKANKHIGKWYGLGSFLLIALNSWSDFQNLPGSTQLVQALVALAIGGMSIIGLPVSIVLIRVSLTKFGAKE